MSTTRKENDDFYKYIMPCDPLDDVIDWISANLEPDDVFDKDQLLEWAKENARDE